VTHSHTEHGDGVQTYLRWQSTVRMVYIIDSFRELIVALQQQESKSYECIMMMCTH